MKLLLLCAFTTLLFRACIAECTDETLMELEAQLEAFDSCKSSLSCDDDETYCSCCSGVDNDCCETYTSAVALYTQCESRLDENNSKRQGIEAVILSIKAYRETLQLVQCVVSLIAEQTCGGSATLACGGLVGLFALLFAVIQHFVW